MVMRYLLFLFVPFALLAVDVQVDVDDDKLIEHQPVSVMVMITHKKQEIVDGQSFVYEGKRVPAHLEREVFFSPDADDLLSIWRVDLPAGTAGRYLLQPLQVTVDGRVYRTPPAVYEIKQALRGVYEEPFLNLEMEIQAKEPIYPGQRVKVVYRYLYRGNIRMTKEELPLLSPAGFRRIGEEVIRDGERGGSSVREILIELEAEKSGHYRFGRSVIEAVGIGRDGEARPLRAEVAPIDLAIAAFPDGATSVVFDGSLGDFSITSELLTAPVVSIGDRMTVAVDIRGNNEQLTNASLPDILCQPGFSGFFSSDNQPLVGKIENGRKRFLVYLRPLIAEVTHIPSIAFNYFDPKDATYKTVATAPIAIQVKAAAAVPHEALAAVAAQARSVRSEEWQASLVQLPPVALSEMYTVRRGDLVNRLFGTWWVFLLFPILFAVLFFKERLLALIPARQKLPSRQMMDLAIDEENEKIFDRVGQALLQRLYELKLCPEGTKVADLGDEGVQGRVYHWILALQDMRYGSKQALSFEEIKNRSEALYNELKEQQ